MYLNVGDKESLERWLEKVHYKDMEYSIFREPDIDNEITALACLTDKKMFNGLPLL